MQTDGQIGRMKLIGTVLQLLVSNVPKNLTADGQSGLGFEPRTSNRTQVVMFVWEVWQRKIM
jgi:hypothetical protein